MEGAGSSRRRLRPGPRERGHRHAGGLRAGVALRSAASWARDPARVTKEKEQSRQRGVPRPQSSRSGHTAGLTVEASQLLSSTCTRRCAAIRHSKGQYLKREQEQRQRWPWRWRWRGHLALSFCTASTASSLALLAGTAGVLQPEFGVSSERRLGGEWRRCPSRATGTRRRARRRGSRAAGGQLGRPKPTGGHSGGGAGAARLTTEAGGPRSPKSHK